MFHLHKDVLTNDSAYFKAALDGPFFEGQAQSIDLDDIEAAHFGLYVSLAYPTALSMKAVSLRDVWTLENTTKCSWTDLLRLWQLADRFLNSKIVAVAQAELNERFIELSVDRWLSRYQNKAWPYIKKYVSDLNCAFRLCQDENLPFQDKYVTGLSHCPPQVFAECVEELDDDFRSAVTKAFALRLADPLLTARKRMRDETKEARRLAKKQK